MRFTLFKKASFDVKHPEALIEAYCFQSFFYKNYDLLLRQRHRRIEDVTKIGARIQENILTACAPIIESHKDLAMFSLSLDAFLKLDDKTKNTHIHKLSEIVRKLVNIKGVALSKATKILHTLYPQIIPIIDNALQKEYKEINPNWTEGDWKQLFMDYYDNFSLVEETYQNLCEVHSRLSFLRMTRIRIFDILWWSYLKAKKLREENHVNWTTIK